MVYFPSKIINKNTNDLYVNANNNTTNETDGSMWNNTRVYKSYRMNIT